MAEDVLQRVKSLIALALGDANENESRNAALQACKLIDKYQLLKAPTPAQDMHALFETLFGDMERQRSERPPYRPPPEHHVAGGSPRPRMPPDPHVRSVLLGMKVLCSECKTVIEPPKLVMISRGRVYHRTCYRSATGQL